MGKLDRELRSAWLDGYYTGRDDQWYRDHDDEGNLRTDSDVHSMLEEYLKEITKDETAD